MEKFNYSADAGSFCIEMGGSFVKFDNGYGDGYHKLFVFENENEFKEITKDKYSERPYSKDFNFVTYSYFNNANVLDYDCCSYQFEDRILTTLNGWYSIYNWLGTIFIIKERN